MVFANTTFFLQGIHIAWMDISSLVTPGSTLQGEYSRNPNLRALSINTAQGILFLFYKSNSSSTIYVHLTQSSDTHEEKVVSPNIYH